MRVLILFRVLGRIDILQNEDGKVTTKNTTPFDTSRIYADFYGIYRRRERLAPAASAGVAMRLLPTLYHFKLLKYALLSPIRRPAVC